MFTWPKSLEHITEISRLPGTHTSIYTVCYVVSMLELLKFFSSDQTKAWIDRTRFIMKRPAFIKVRNTAPYIQYGHSWTQAPSPRDLELNGTVLPKVTQKPARIYRRPSVAAPPQAPRPPSLSFTSHEWRRRQRCGVTPTAPRVLLTSPPIESGCRSSGEVSVPFTCRYLPSFTWRLTRLLFSTAKALRSGRALALALALALPLLRVITGTTICLLLYLSVAECAGNLQRGCFFVQI